MLENILAQKNVGSRVKITVKTAVSVFLIALSAILPQIVHIAAGAAGGMTWLPMYLPVLIGGCLLGSVWGLGIGALSPAVSFLITSLAGNPMPALERLPFMIIELSVFAAVSGMFSKKIFTDKWMAFPSVLLAQVSGRGIFLLLATVLQNALTFDEAAAWSQIQTGFAGLILQAVLVPLIIIFLAYVMEKHTGSEKN